MQDESSGSQEAEAGEGGCGGFVARGNAFSACVKRRPVGDDGELMTLHFRCEVGLHALSPNWEVSGFA